MLSETGSIIRLGRYFCLVVLLSFSVVVTADETEKEKIQIPPPLPAFTEHANQDETADPLIVGIPCEDISNDPVQAACWDALQRRFEYYAAGMDHRSLVFKWQHFSGRVILGFVLLLVSMGVFFSYLQFRLYLRSASSANKQAASPEMDTDLELSTSGIKVSSNVLGVIILALSLAFFYLYLAYVYPIQDTF